MVRDYPGGALAGVLLPDPAELEAIDSLLASFAKRKGCEVLLGVRRDLQPVIQVSTSTGVEEIDVSIKDGWFRGVRRSLWPNP